MIRRMMRGLVRRVLRLFQELQLGSVPTLARVKKRGPEHSLAIPQTPVLPELPSRPGCTGQRLCDQTMGGAERSAGGDRIEP
jgi:hypothetical protein